MKETINGAFKKYWVVIVFIFVIILSVLTYQTVTAKAEVNGEKLSYDKIVEKVKEKEDELEEREKDLRYVKGQIEDAKDGVKDAEDEAAEVFALLDRKDDIADEMEELESTLSDKKADMEKMDEDISEKEAALKKVGGKLKEAKGDPISLLAGQWIVGSDVPANRYQAKGSSNFVVRGSAGSLKVNTILRDGDYVFFAEDGDIIEAHAATTLTPVE